MGLPTRPALVQSVELSAIGPAEEIAEGAAQEQRQSTLFEVPGAVVIEMAALAEGGKIVVGVVGGVLVKMSAGEGDECPLDAGLVVEPASLAQMVDKLAVRSAAAVFGTFESDGERKLAPTDRIEFPILTPDGHRSHPGRSRPHSLPGPPCRFCPALRDYHAPG